MSLIVAGVANVARKRFSREAGNFIADREFRKKRLMQFGAGVLVCAGAGAGLYNTFSDNMKQVLPPVSHGVAIEVGKQKVKDIDLSLDERCVTGYTAEAASTAKNDHLKVGALALQWTSEKVVADYDVELCLDPSEIEAKLYTGGDQPDKIVMRVPAEAVRTDVSVNPITVRTTPDHSPMAVQLENIRNIVNATPLLEDLGFIKDGVAAVDANADFLRAAAQIKAGESVGSKCLAGVKETAMPAFLTGLANDVLLGASLYNADLVRTDVEVLIGDAKTEADNLSQTIGTRGNYVDFSAKLDKVLAANNSINFVADDGASSAGSCEVSDEVKKDAEATHAQLTESTS